MEQDASAMDVFVFNPKRAEREPWVKALVEDHTIGGYSYWYNFGFVVREYADGKPRDYEKDTEEEVAEVKSQNRRAQNYDAENPIPVVAFLIKMMLRGMPLQDNIHKLILSHYWGRKSADVRNGARIILIVLINLNPK